MASIKTTEKFSLINKYFSKDLLLELLKITLITMIDNNGKGILIKELLTENNIPWSGLGPGTNRMAVQIDGMAVKFALDEDGKIDNRREFLYTQDLYPRVIKVYECEPSGLIAVTEYVDIFTMQDFQQRKDEVREILEELSENFFIGDVGISTKNYVNWGTRSDGSICILDFAYIYNIKFSKIFYCKCNDERMLQYDENFNSFVCPVCGTKYTFGQIRRKITRKEQEEEIGDIRRLSYNLTKEREVVPYNPQFEPKPEKKEKKVDPIKLEIKKYKEKKKRQKEEFYE